MTDSSAPAPRPVSLVTIVAILGTFALFLLLVDLAYLPHRPAAPQLVAAEKLSDDQAWKATPESRKANLLELRAKQQKQATSYGWVDQKTGVVQLPIDRAMELVVRQYGAKP
jgi:hypothetical protein